MEFPKYIYVLGQSSNNILRCDLQKVESEDCAIYNGAGNDLYSVRERQAQKFGYASRINLTTAKYYGVDQYFTDLNDAIIWRHQLLDKKIVEARSAYENLMEQRKQGVDTYYTEFN